MPLKTWLNTDLAFLIKDYLNESVINEFNIIEFSEVQNLLQNSS